MSKVPEFYKEDIKRCWASPRMQKYEESVFSNYFMLENGKYVVFTKPSIEKNFCFDDSYDYDGAQRMANHAATNEDYFLSENLKQFDTLIEQIEKYHVGFRLKYCGEPEDCNLCAYELYDDWSDPRGIIYQLNDLEKLGLIKTVQDEKSKFEKRLHTYLKRYGMSKVNAWTYWGMA